MGYDIVAYYNVDQEEIERFITENNINRDNWDECDETVPSYYKEKYLADEKRKLRPNYIWNPECGIHELYESYGTNFIRDDERFDNRRFQKILEEKFSRTFPSCLKNINYYLRTCEDAIEIAAELRIFFSEDSRLMGFAEWLESTSKYCETYELSF